MTVEHGDIAIMAAETKTRHNKFAAPIFTLPISCQICLGKVKQPVLCPNHHVFCAYCMEIWLERNQQCPACRVPINEHNPVKHIRGGLNQPEDDEKIENSTELRRARFNLLFQEYEDELDHLQEEVRLLKTENDILKSNQHEDSNINRLQTSSSKSSIGPASVEANDRLLLLTKKLQDVQKLYDKVKQDISKYKQENGELKDENINLVRENAKLREEIAHRSPYRYGRYTVATLESQLEGQQKEIARLKKALERSDQYIKELEHQIQCSQGSIKHSTPKRSHKKLNTDSKKEKLHQSQTNSKLSQKSVQEDNVLVDIKNPAISIKNEINQQHRGVISGQPVARQLFGGGGDDYATFGIMKLAEKLDEKHLLSQDCHVQNVQGEPVQLEDERYSNGLTHISRTDRGLVKDTGDMLLHSKSLMGNAVPEKLRTDEINRINYPVPENGKISIKNREISGVPKHQKGNFHLQTKDTQSWHTSDRHPNIRQLFKEEEDLVAKQNVRSDRSKKAFETQDFDSMYNGICKKYGLNPVIDYHAKGKERTVLKRDIPESIMKKPELSGNSDFRERSPGKRVQFELNEKKSDETSSFDLEMPSPLASSTSIGKVSVNSGDVSVDILPAYMPSSANAQDMCSSKVSKSATELATSELCKRDVHNLPCILSEQLSNHEVSYPSGVHSHRSILERKRTENMESDLLQISSSQGQSSEFQSSSVLSGPDVSTPQSLTDYTSRHSQASQSFAKTKRESGSFDLEGPGLDDTQTIQTELSDLDISMTPELTDCLKLLNRAEKKVYQSDLTDFGKHLVGLEASHVPAPLHVSMPRTYIAGTANVLSGWEHGFFSSLKVNPYRHSTMSQQPSGYHYGNIAGNGSGWTNSLMGNSGISNTRVDTASQSSDLKQADNGAVQSCLPNLQAARQSLAEKLFALPVDTDGNPVPPRPASAPSASSNLLTYAASTIPSTFLSTANSNAHEKSTVASGFNSHIDSSYGFSGASRSVSDFGLDLLKSGKCASSVSSGKYGNSNYSYVSDASSMIEGPSIKSVESSFSPEPKKRLFDSDDDMELSSPNKTTKIL